MNLKEYKDLMLNNQSSSGWARRFLLTQSRIAEEARERLDVHIARSPKELRCFVFSGYLIYRYMQC